MLTPIAGVFIREMRGKFRHTQRGTGRDEERELMCDYTSWNAEGCQEPPEAKKEGWA